MADEAKKKVELPPNPKAELGHVEITMCCDAATAAKMIKAHGFHAINQTGKKVHLAGDAKTLASYNKKG